jgi:hypothetical protein
MAEEAMSNVFLSCDSSEEDELSSRIELGLSSFMGGSNCLEPSALAKESWRKVDKLLLFVMDVVEAVVRLCSEEGDLLMETLALLHRFMRKYSAMTPTSSEEDEELFPDASGVGDRVEAAVPAGDMGTLPTMDNSR